MGPRGKIYGTYSFIYYIVLVKVKRRSGGSALRVFAKARGEVTYATYLLQEVLEVVRTSWRGRRERASEYMARKLKYYEPLTLYTSPKT